MRHSRRPDDLFAEINIVPFTDVVLVLLIIFMITANFMATGSALTIELPQARSATQQDQGQAAVFVTADGQVYLNSQPTTPQALTSQLQARKRDNPNIVVVISADRKVPYETVVAVLDAARSAGVEYLALAAEAPGAQQR